MRLWGNRKEASPERDKDKDKEAPPKVPRLSAEEAPKVSPRSRRPLGKSPRQRATQNLQRLRRVSVKELIFSSSPGGAKGAAAATPAGSKEANQTVVAFVLRSFLGEWVERANSKLRDGVEKTEAQMQAALEDPNFQQLLDSLGRVGRHNLDEVVNVLLAWRQASVIEAPAVAKHLAGKNKPEALEERHLILTEMLFCQALNAVLVHVSHDNLTDVQSAKVEELCFLNSIPHRGNNPVVNKLYAQCLGCLAPYRMGEIRAKFDAYVQDFIKAPSKHQRTLQHVVEAMGHLRLEIGSEQNVQEIISFLSIFQMLVARSRGKVVEAMRPQVLLALTAMLRPLLVQSKQLPAGVDYSLWTTFVMETFQLFSKKLMGPKAKEKDAPYFSILSILLCLSSTEFFTANYLALTEFIAVPKLIKKERRLEGKLGFTYLLEALSPLVERFLSPEFDGDAQAQQEMLELLRARLFEIRDKRLGPLPEESLDSVVAIIVSMGRKKTLFTLQRVIYPILGSTGAGSDEKIIVGLRVVHQLYVSGVDMSQATELGELLGLILSHTDTLYGRALLMEKPVEVPPTTLTMFEEAILAVRYVTPTRWTASDLYAKLSSFVVHQQPVLQDAAKRAMSFLMETAPHHRADLLHTCAGFMVDLEFTRTRLIELLLSHLQSLVETWSSVLEGSREPAGDMGLDFARMEGIALCFLCSPLASIRSPAMDLLESLRGLYQLSRVSKFASSSESVRVLTIFEEMEPEIVRSFTSDFRFRRIDNPTFHPEQNLSLDEVMINDQAVAMQNCWTYTLATVFKVAVRLCPSAMQVCRSLCVLRLVRLPIVNEKTPLLDRVHAVSSYQNHALACVCSWHGNSLALDTWIESRLPADTTAVSDSRALLMGIVTQTLKVPAYWGAGGLVMGYCHEDMYELLCECLETGFEGSGKQSRAGPLRMRKMTASPYDDAKRWDLTSSVFSRLSDAMQQENRGTLRRNTKLREHFLRVIEHLHRYLTQHDSVVETQLFSVRYSFFTIVRNVAEDLNSSEGTSNGMSAGLRGGLFAYLVRWTEGLAMMDKRTTKEQIASHARTAKSPEAHEQFLQLLKEQVSVLQFFACQAAASLVSTPWPSPITADHPVMTWLVSLLKNTMGRAAKSLKLVALDAVSSFLIGNYKQAGMLDVAYDHCYPRLRDTTDDRTVPDVFFYALVELMEARPDCPRQLDRLLHVVLAKTGDSKIEVRRAALKLLQLVTYSSPVRWEEFDSLSTDSQLDDTYRQTQMTLSGRLAKGFQFMSQGLFDEMVLRVEKLSVGTRKQALEYVVPWLSSLQLYTCSPAVLHKTLFNFCLITYRFQGEHPLQIQRMWQKVAQDLGNLDPLIAFLLHVGSRKRNAEFIPLAKKIVLYVSRAAPEVTVSALVEELTSLASGADATTPVKKRPAAAAASALDEAMVSHPFQHAMPDDGGSLYLPSAGHLALILVSELAFEASFHFREHLPTVLQQVFLGFTHPQALVCEHSRMLLLNLIQALVVDRFTQQSPEEVAAGVGVYEEDYHEGVQLVEFLKSKAGKPMFQSRTDYSVLLATVVENVIQTLSPKMDEDAIPEDYVSLSDRWAAEAYSWAMFCPLPHLQSCSFVIYRALSPALSKEALGGMVETLARAVVRAQVEHAALASNILSTLNAMLKQTDVNALSVFTQIFWAAVAVLHSDIESHFMDACSIIEVVLSSLNFGDNLIQNVFAASVPEYDHTAVQLLVHRGLWAPQTEPHAVRLLTKFTALPVACDSMIQSQFRVLGNVIGLLPWLLIHATNNDANHESGDIAHALGRFCAQHKKKRLAAAFLGWAEYSTPRDFLTALTPAFVDEFLPQHQMFVLQFAFDLLERGPVKYQRAMMQLLSFVMPHSDTTAGDIAQFMPQWLSILERSINGPLMSDALAVLDIALSQSDKPEQYSISLAHVAHSGFSTPVSYAEFSNKVSEGNESASRELTQLLKSHGLEINSPEEVVSQAFFAKFVQPSSADDASWEQQSGGGGTGGGVAGGDNPMSLETDDVFGFGAPDAGFSGFSDLLANLDAEGPAEDGGLPSARAGEVSFVSLNDEFNTAWREKTAPKACSAACGLLPLLYDSYLDAALLGLDSPSGEGLRLLASRYEHLLVGQDLVDAYGSIGAVRLEQEQVTGALTRFGEALRNYVTAKAVFDKRARKGGQLLSALAELNEGFLRVSQAGFEFLAACSPAYQPPSAEVFQQAFEENQQLKNELNAE